MTPYARALLICLAAYGVASQAATPAMPPDLPPIDTQGRVVWGKLLKPETTSPFAYFSAWTRLHEQADASRAPTIVGLDAYLARQDRVPAALAPNTTPGQPKAELQVDARGETFQGVSLSLARLDASGRPAPLQPWSTGVGKDERFRIRVLASFDAVVVLGTRNSKGRFTQVYPARNGMAVVARAGEPFWLPVGDKAHLQFAGDPALNPLTLTVRDARSFGTGHAATGPAYLQDEGLATHLLQAVEADTYPAIAVQLPGLAKP